LVRLLFAIMWRDPVARQTRKLIKSRSRLVTAAGVIARIAFTVLGLSGEQVHEPVHAQDPASPHPATARKRCWWHGSEPASGQGARADGWSVGRYAHNPVSRHPDLPKGVHYIRAYLCTERHSYSWLHATPPCSCNGYPRC